MLENSSGTCDAEHTKIRSELGKAVFPTFFTKVM